MISETTLATGFSSFWGKTLPYSERAIRKINLGMSEYLFLREKIIVDPARKAFLNEIAFHLFCLDINEGLNLARKTTKNSNLKDAEELARKHQRKFIHITKDDLHDPDETEYKDIDSLIDGLNALLKQYPDRKVLAQPRFSGCGMLNENQGDLIINDILYEIKGADRKFRSVDVRQLLIYCSLNADAHHYPIKKAGCYNPRTGQHFCFTLDGLSLEMSGKNSSELFAEIVYYLSSGDVSR